MKFIKPALTYTAQADLLLSRGLVADRDVLIRRLKAVGYYRLCSYWHPFKLPNDQFEPGTSLDVVWARYSFDRKLRLAAIDAIERVEVAVRCALIDDLVVRHADPFVHLNAANFWTTPDDHQRFIEDLQKEALRSREVFIEHFKATYEEFPDVPLWAAAEMMTFGSMFTLFRMSERRTQQAVARQFEIPQPVLFSWLKTLNYVRNLCAHHSRLWNRMLAIRPVIPDQRNDRRWHSGSPITNDRMFVVLTLLRVLLLKIAPRSQWRERLYACVDGYDHVPLSAMGIPDDWREHELWR